ncbi:hypothetical protein [Algoriphagus namhaensis]
MSEPKFIYSLLDHWEDYRVWDIRPDAVTGVNALPGAEKIKLCSKREYQEIKTKGFQNESGKQLMQKIDQLSQKVFESPKPIVLIDLSKDLVAKAFWQHYRPVFPIYIYKPGFSGLLNECEVVFSAPQAFVQLKGKTGSGKSELLQILKKQGAQVLDLGELAKHRGSAFGNLENHRQPSQEEFNLSLALKLKGLQPEKSTFVEFEGSNLGQILIPLKLQEMLEKGKQIWLELDETHRAHRLVSDYARINDREILKGIEQLSFRLGREKVDSLGKALIRKEYLSVAQELLAYFDLGETYQMEAKSRYSLILGNEDPEKTAGILISQYP